MHVDLIKTYRVESAHETQWGGEGPCLHGHSLQIEIVVGGDCDPELGWLVDYAEITQRFDDLYNALDHHLLNEVPGLADPGVAGLSAWLKERLAKKLDNLMDVHVSIIGARSFRPQVFDADGLTGLPARVRFDFEAAHALPRLPEAHKCRRMHGHSFTVEVAAANLDLLKPELREVYDLLDHSCLNEIEGLQNPTSEEVSRWIWNRLASKTLDLKAVIVAETCTARCVYYGS